MYKIAIAIKTNSKKLTTKKRSPNQKSVFKIINRFKTVSFKLVFQGYLTGNTLVDANHWISVLIQ